MPRDYAQKKHAPRAKAAPSSRVPRWVWLLTSGVVVLFAGGLFFLSQQPEEGGPIRFEMPSLSELKPDTSATPQPSQPQTAESEPDAQSPTLSRRAQLEFYTLLQQTDVLVPDEILALRQREALAEPEAETGQDAASATSVQEPEESGIEESPGQFVIQVASFSNQRDADNLRAQLILEGMTRAHVTAANLGDRGTFYRVMVGPVTSNRETQSIATRLDNMGLQGLVRNHSDN